MEVSLKQILIDAARSEIKSDDPSHDFLHAHRVMTLAEEIALDEKADVEVLIPAALFHDVIVYPKNHSLSKNEADESAEYTGNLLRSINEYPVVKIEKVMECIRVHSFSKGITPELLEAKILQDADRLEATGAISILRTFASTGQMKRPFYNESDPFCENRDPEPFNYGLDLFYTRLLKVEGMMHTNLAKNIAQKRTAFLRSFLQQLESELDGR
jgi:uncharacterized protein